MTCSVAQAKAAAREALLAVSVVLAAACSSGGGGSHGRGRDAGTGGAPGEAGRSTGGSVADGGPGKAGNGTGGAAGAAQSTGGSAGSARPTPDAQAPDGAPSNARDGGSLEGGSGVDGSAQGGILGTAGGTVAGPHGASITAPQGALTGSVTFGIAEDATGAPSLPAGMVALGPIDAFTPHGAQFAKPVTIHVPFDAASVPSGATPLLLQAEPGGAFAQIPAQVDGDAMTASVSTFSWFVVARAGQIVSVKPAIAAGGGFSCAIRSDGTVRCWGDNSNGELGNNSMASSTMPVTVLGLTNAVAISAGQLPYACAVLSDGTVQCWGGDAYGQLGIDPPADRSTPVSVSGITNAVAISAGPEHACALLADGTAKCWGFGENCQIGFQDSGACTSSRLPVAIASLTDAVAISAGEDHTCALLSTGQVRCWGDNTYGELGTGSTSPRESVTPVDVVGLTSFVAIATANHISCGVVQDGEIYCWGEDLTGLTPVANVTTAIAISMQFQHSCALQSDGEVQCWGSNTHGELGDGTTTNSVTPVKVLGLTTATAISVGIDQTCALLTDGTARCWGGNDYGELGSGSTTSSSLPVPVSQL